MKITVCVKQVPDTNDITWTENNTIQREGVESIINPFDLYALNIALKIKGNLPDVSVSALSMGPLQAEKVLKKALALGCDNAILLSDKKFAASDTFATSKIISRAISEKIADYDLIICGQYAIDGDTAQTGPGIAANLGIPQVTYVKEIQQVTKNNITVKRETDDGYEIVSVKLPALLCVINTDDIDLRADISGYINAHNSKIIKYNAEDLSLDASEIGIKGSPTFVSKSFRPEIKKSGEIIQSDNIKNCADMILKKIEEYKA